MAANAPGSKVQSQHDISIRVAGTRLTGHLGSSTKVASCDIGQQGQPWMAHEQVSNSVRLTVGLNDLKGLFQPK